MSTFNPPNTGMNGIPSSRAMPDHPMHPDNLPTVDDMAATRAQVKQMWNNATSWMPPSHTVLDLRSGK